MGNWHDTSIYIHLHPFTSHHTLFLSISAHIWRNHDIYSSTETTCVALLSGRLVSLLHPSYGTLQNQRGIYNKTFVSKSSLFVCNIAVQTVGCNAFVDLQPLKTLKEFENVSSFVWHLLLTNPSYNERQNQPHCTSPYVKSQVAPLKNNYQCMSHFLLLPNVNYLTNEYTLCI